VVWLLDNGHGKDTEGKRSPDGSLKEWEFTRAIVSNVVDKLDVLGIGYVVLVPEERDIPLEERVERANSVNAFMKVYVSIHANAYTDDWNDASGVETYCFPKSKRGKWFAKNFQKHLLEQTRWKDRGVKEKPFYMLSRTSMPAVLTECGFYTNLIQCKQMKSEDYIERIGLAHVRAIFESETKKGELLC